MTRPLIADNPVVEDGAIAFNFDGGRMWIPVNTLLGWSTGPTWVDLQCPGPTPSRRIRCDNPLQLARQLLDALDQLDPGDYTWP